MSSPFKGIQGLSTQIKQLQDVLKCCLCSSKTSEFFMSSCGEDICGSCAESAQLRSELKITVRSNKALTFISESVDKLADLVNNSKICREHELQIQARCVDCDEYICCSCYKEDHAPHHLEPVCSQKLDSQVELRPALASYHDDLLIEVKGLARTIIAGKNYKEKPEKYSYFDRGLEYMGNSLSCDPRDLMCPSDSSTILYWECLLVARNTKAKYGVYIADSCLFMNNSDKRNMIRFACIEHSIDKDGTKDLSHVKDMQCRFHGMSSCQTIEEAPEGWHRSIESDYASNLYILFNMRTSVGATEAICILDRNFRPKSFIAIDEKPGEHTISLGLYCSFDGPEQRARCLRTVWCPEESEDVQIISVGEKPEVLLQISAGRLPVKAIWMCLPSGKSRITILFKEKPYLEFFESREGKKEKYVLKFAFQNMKLNLADATDLLYLDSSSLMISDAGAGSVYNILLQDWQPTHEFRRSLCPGPIEQPVSMTSLNHVTKGRILCITTLRGRTNVLTTKKD